MQPYPTVQNYQNGPYTYGGVTTPSQVYQERLNNLQQQFPQLGQQNNRPQQQVQPATQIQAVAVTSIDEAKVYPISFDSTIYLIYDTSTGNIYRKQFDMNSGGALFSPYVPYQAPAEEKVEQTTKEPDKESETRHEGNKEIETLKHEVSDLKEELKKVKEEINNAKSITAAPVDVGAESTDTADGKSTSKRTESAGNASGDGKK